MDEGLRASLMETLKSRFEQHMHRHPEIDWKVVQERLEASPSGLRSLHEMERTGGEPDVIGRDETTGMIIFADCSPESPSGRRSLCYDRAALDARKKNKPEGNVMEMAESMGIQVLTEAQYRELQKLGSFDTKTSSWVLTPEDIRAKDGAVFCDRRYGHVWVYHNGAQSYYASRGFRGMLKV